MQNKLYKYDLNLKKQYPNILGIDEVGRGCVAGPLVVVGVILNDGFYDSRIQDSKKIKSISKREELAHLILKNCKKYLIVSYDALYVDLHNPKQSAKNGMLEIAQKLKGYYDVLITDYENIPDETINQINIIKGDDTSFTIACASIVAKSYRDKGMEKLNKKYPQYDFLNNQGYLTNNHKKLIEEHKPIKGVHRFSYKFIKSISK